MSTRSVRGTPIAAAGCLVALMLLTAPLARAADPDVPTDTADGWQNVYRYSRCAFAVLHAVTPLDWAAAAFDCVRLFLSEPPTSGVA
jgi:hypothetical protein